MSVRRCLAPVLAFTAVLLTFTAIAAGLPAPAQATLSFVRNLDKPSIWVADNNGSKAHRLTSGMLPRVSPDGGSIAYMTAPTGNSYNPSLMIVPANGGAPPRRLARGWREGYTFAWSPDSKMIAAVLGPEIGRQRLTLFDLAAGTKRTIASGYFYGVSFSPSGKALVFAKAGSERYPLRSDVYKVSLARGAPKRITNDHRSLYPLWGPNGKVALVKLLEGKRRRYGPKNEIYLVNQNGSHSHRLTHTVVDPLLQGLTPTQWSSNGRRMLAEFGGQDTSYAVTVNPRTGAQRTVGRRRGLIGAALSSNGRSILGATGGPEPGPHHDVVSVPYRGGPMRILAANAYDPDWSR